MNNTDFSDQQLSEAARRVCESMLESLQSGSEPEHTFSDRFITKINVLRSNIRRRKRSAKLMRIAAAVFLAVIVGFGALMAASPMARAAVQNWLLTVFEHKADYQFTGDTGGELPVYVLSWIPDGFVLEAEDRYEALHTLFYRNPTTDEIIGFNYSYMNEGTASGIFSGEAPLIREQLSVNGMPADFYPDEREKEPSILLWFDEKNNIVFSITSDLDRFAIFRMAENIILADSTK